MMRMIRADLHVHTCHQMLRVRADADIAPAYLVWKPFGIIPVEAINQDVAPLAVPDLGSSGAFREQEQFFEETLSVMTGLYPYNMGQTPARQEHVGTIYSPQSMGEARTKILMMTMDHQGFRPFLKYLMYLNMLYLDPKTEARINSDNGQQFVPHFSGDLHFDYDFSARYTALEPAVVKQLPGAATHPVRPEVAAVSVFTTTSVYESHP